MNRIPIKCILPLGWLLLATGLQAQNPGLPMDIPLFLSGNFGELRSNHFHSGLDFKTQSVTGIPVKAVDDGYIARINVSPYGYGKALYINHPGGTTSVYAHLDRFAPDVEALVCDSQYRREAFAVNLYFPAGKLPVKKGERIAWSGNSGSSGGPHLHFEIRETKSEKAVDPLPFFKSKITDTRPPEIRGLMLYPQRGKGIVNGKTANQPVALVKNKAGQPGVDQPVTAWGAIGVGIKAYDRMNGTTNIYGVNEIVLKVDGKTVFHSVMNRFSFDETRYLNALIDWHEWTENHSFYMKSFIDPGNLLSIYRSSGNGIILINEEKTYQLEYLLTDVYGNETSLKFNIRGEKAPVPDKRPGTVYFPFHRYNSFSGKGITLEVPRKSLYADLYLNIDTVAGHSPYAPQYIIGERIPLHSHCPLTLEIPTDTHPDKSKYGIVQLLKEEKNWLGGKYKGGKIRATTRELGTFTVEADTVPPVITPVNRQKWTANRRIAFKIDDDLSGIASFRGTLDGQFILFEYDAKNRSLYTGSGRMKKRTETPSATSLHLVVRDKAGNESEFTATVLL
ncbi:MAG: M23 family metallopeptidase [Dysgonamonadaceae bacterium]|jgi:murein DD-endopeptidase MepM/ murein hydrolase activator NlpD|nr:M23 family metallopeptidase [Dysgonamonadaceae bacterium]